MGFYFLMSFGPGATAASVPPPPSWWFDDTSNSSRRRLREDDGMMCFLPRMRKENKPQNTNKELPTVNQATDPISPPAAPLMPLSAASRLQTPSF